VCHAQTLAHCAHRHEHEWLMNGARIFRAGTSQRAKRCSGRETTTLREVSAMTKTLTALATAAALSVAVVALPEQSQAAWRGHGHWGGGGAFIGGLAAGAIVGGALAGPYYYGGYDGPYYGDYAYSGYGGYGYGYGHCWRERIATPYGWRWRRVCD
jgi:hypothetical protein